MIPGPSTSIEEEPWEADVGALLGGLSAVEPPEGFIDRAIDHRPRHAGRIIAVLLFATMALLGVVATTGIVDRAAVVPPIDDLIVRHDLAARSGFPAEGLELREAEGGASPLSLPEGFQPEGTLAAEEIRQAVYARGDEAVSVFVQQGPVAWSALPPSGLTELGGVAAWVDDDRRVAVIEADRSTVTVIGLAPEELDETLRGVSRVSSSAGQRIRDLAEAVVVTFGYAPAG